MCANQTPEFDTDDRERAYELIRENGPVSHAQLRDAEVLPMASRRSWQILAILRRDGYVTEVEGMLRDSHQPGESEELQVEDVGVRVREARLEGLAGVIRQVIEGETDILGETIVD